MDGGQREFILARIRVEDRGHATPCWIWQKEKDGRGYARAGSGKTGRLRIHRLSYEVFIGPIADGLHVDHLCCVTSCVNPAHLEPVAAEENHRRKCERRGFVLGGKQRAKNPGIGRGTWRGLRTACKHGHPFTAENTRHCLNNRGRPKRECLSCKRIQNQARTRRQQELRASGNSAVDRESRFAGEGSREATDRLGTHTHSLRSSSHDGTGAQ